MKTFESLSSFKEWRQSHLNKVGFVPTMGALHRGHLELVRRATMNGGPVVVSIVVNPTQFNAPQDMERYPRPLEQDLRLLEDAGVAAVLLPKPHEIYNDDYRYELSEKQDSNVLCGPTRPGHFNGVLTVVLKLFQIVRPTHAFFGEKDYQQLKLIEGMVNAFFLDVEIVPVPTVREADGLAMSSRNLLLTEDERKLAPKIYEALTTARNTNEARERLENAGFKVDYVEEHWGRRFAAAFLGRVRLIDNVAL